LVRPASLNGDIRRAAHGYEPTREAAMAAFAKGWRRESFKIGKSAFGGKPENVC